MIANQKCAWPIVEFGNTIKSFGKKPTTRGCALGFGVSELGSRAAEKLYSYKEADANDMNSQALQVCRAMTAARKQGLA